MVRAGLFCFAILIGVAREGSVRAEGMGSAAKPQSETSDLRTDDQELPQWKRVLDHEDSTQVEELTMRIRGLREQANYADAIPLAERIWQIRSRAQGDDHWETADAARLMETLKHVAGLPPSSQERLAEADQAETEILKLYEQAEYGEAAALVRQHLETRKQMLGDEHPEVAESIADLAEMSRMMGNYAIAEPLFRQELVMNRAVLGDKHPNVVRALNNLAFASYKKGDYARIEPLLRQAIDMNRELLGEEHPRFISAINNLGVFLFSSGDYEGAEPLLRKALESGRRMLGDENPTVAFCLHNLGLLHHRRGQYSQAESYFRDALTMRLNLYGEEHPLLAETLHGLAAQHELTGAYALAESLYSESLSMTEKIFDADHPQAAKSRFGLASVMHLRGDYGGAEATWLAAVESFEVARQHRSLGGLGRVQFTATWSPREYLAACLARNGKPREAWHHLEAHLSRGLLDEISARSARLQDSEERAREQDLKARLSELEERIGALVSAMDDGSELAGDVDSLHMERDALLVELEEFEAEMAYKYVGHTATISDMERIQACLENDAAMIAWVDVKGRADAADPNGEHWACIIRNHGEPVWARLRGSGDNDAWTTADDELPNRLREKLTRRSSERGLSRDSDLSKRLYKQRFAPLEKHLSEVTRLIVLPGGWMTGVPVDVLTDRYTISYAPSGTVYGGLKENRGTRLRPTTAWQASAEGRGSEEETQMSAGQGEVARRPPREGEAMRSPPWSGVAQRRPLLAMGDPVFHRTEPADGQDSIATGSQDELLGELPGTRLEVYAIQRLFTVVNREAEPHVLLGAEASERRIDELAKAGTLERFRFIHLATHAMMDDRAAMQSALILSGDEPEVAFDLAVKGENVYDGRLTAEHIARTWSLNAELVTLSACETALGRESGGEGFLGFSQALFLAGARSLVLSLWRVEDTATTLLMTRFYENLLGAFDGVRNAGNEEFRPGTPLPKAVALREAKNWLRTMTWDELELEPVIEGYVARGLVPVDGSTGRSETKNPFADPHFWAAFILTGDPE